jgi:hypothetical protein
MTPKAGPPHLRLRREQGSEGKTIWSLDPSCRDGYQPPPLSANEKTPVRGGPFKAAYTHRFIAVVGTLGDDDVDALLMAKARYDADWWWHLANGRFEICTDIDFEPRQHQGRNVIIYGNHDQNAAWSKVLGDGAPIDVRNGAFVGPTACHEGDDIGVLFVYPRADCDQSQVGVVAATGAKGMRTAMRLRIYASMFGVPDLVAFRAAMLTDGEKGVIEAGFFGNDWSTKHGTWIKR